MCVNRGVNGVAEVVRGPELLGLRGVGGVECGAGQTLVGWAALAWLVTSIVWLRLATRCLEHRVWGALVSRSDADTQQATTVGMWFGLDSRSGGYGGNQYSGVAFRPS